MAVRFDNTGQGYTRTITLGATSAFSVTCWVKVSVDRDTYSTAWCLDSNATSDYWLLQTGSTGTILTASSEGAANSVASATVGTWYFVGVSVSASAVVVKVRAFGAGSFTTPTPPATTGSATNMTRLRLGQSVFAGGEWLNGCLAGVKVWTAALSATELEAEYPQFDPVRTSNLFAYYRLSSASTTDNSGNGQTLTGGTGATTEAGPALSGSSTASPAVVSAVASIPAPTVSAGSATTATPSVVAAVASVPTPTVSAQQSVTATPAVVAAVASIPSPTVSTGGIEFVAATHAESVTGTLPAGTQTGDVLLAIMQDSVAPDGPAGWTQLGADRVGTQFSGNAWTIVVGASSPDLTWTGGGDGPIVDILAYRGSSGVESFSQGGTADPVAPSVTTTAANSTIVALYADESSNSMTAPAGMTLRTPGSAFAYNAEADQLIAAPGATGSRQFGGTSNAIGTWLIVLPPAAPDGDATATPSVVTSTTTIPAPSTSTGSTASPAMVAATTSVPVPSTSAGSRATPSVVAATASVPAPTTSTGSTASPSVVVASASIPTASVSAGATASPAVVQATATVPAPSVTAVTAASPSVVTGTASIPAPSVSTGSTAAPSVVGATTSVPAPTTTTGATASPGVVPATTTIPTPAVEYGQTATPAVVAAVASIPSPAVQTGSSSTATPVTVTATASIPSPSVTAGTTANAAVVAATASVGAPTISAGATASPGAVEASASIPAPSVATGATASPDTIQATATIPTPTVTAGGNATAQPPVVAATASIPAPAVSTSSTAQPTVVLATAAVPTPTTTVLVAATPAVVNAFASIPAALVSTTARPPTVTAVASIPVPSVSTGQIGDIHARLGDTEAKRRWSSPSAPPGAWRADTTRRRWSATR